MSVYLASYDLNKPEKDYPKLLKRLEEWKATRILYSEWIIRSSSTAVQIRDDLKNYVDANDSLLILKLEGEAAWTKTQVANDRLVTLLKP